MVDFTHHRRPWDIDDRSRLAPLEPGIAQCLQGIVRFPGLGDGQGQILWTRLGQGRQFVRAQCRYEMLGHGGKIILRHLGDVIGRANPGEKAALACVDALRQPRNVRLGNVHGRLNTHGALMDFFDHIMRIVPLIRALIAIPLNRDGISVDGLSRLQRLHLVTICLQ